MSHNWSNPVFKDLSARSAGQVYKMVQVVSAALTAFRSQAERSASWATPTYTYCNFYFELYYYNKARV